MKVSFKKAPTIFKSTVAWRALSRFDNLPVLQDDILEYRRAEIARKEARVQELEALLAAARLEADGCKRLICQLKVEANVCLSGEHMSE